MSNRKNNQIHQQHKQARSARFGEGVYGVVQKPVVIKGDPFVCDLPSYIKSNQTCRFVNQHKTSQIFINHDLRCFYTGVLCKPPDASLGDLVNWPLQTPWMGTRDHLVPARRFISNQPRIFINYTSAKIWSARIVNLTLGLSPLPVRLKIRQWLQTVNFDRTDCSPESGANVRWIIVDMLDTFRIQGRYPWSLNSQGQWWYPEISEPFMNRMWKMEQEFLSLGAEDRNKWITSFDWQF